MITDGSGEVLVAQTFAQIPEIIRDFLALQDPVLRADILRYLILYAHGGIYTDVDTVCLKPFSTWIPAAFKNKTNVIVGIKGDSLGGPIIEGFTHHVGIGQWTVAAKPGHFMLERVIERVLSRLRMLAEKQNSTISDLQPSYKDESALVQHLFAGPWKHDRLAAEGSPIEDSPIEDSPVEDNQVEYILIDDSPAEDGRVRDDPLR